MFDLTWEMTCVSSFLHMYASHIPSHHPLSSSTPVTVEVPSSEIDCLHILYTSWFHWKVHPLNLNVSLADRFHVGTCVLNVQVQLMRQRRYNHVQNYTDWSGHPEDVWVVCCQYILSMQFHVTHPQSAMNEVTSLSCGCRMKRKILCVQLYDWETTCWHFD